MKLEHIPAGLRLGAHSYECDEPDTIVTKQINPYIIPSRYYI